MSADERRGLRFALLVLALASVLGATISWLFLDGYNQQITLAASGALWLGAVLAQIVFAPRTHKRPRRTEGA